MIRQATDEPALQLSLEAFEGPLDLLLELARQRKVDLARVSLSELADAFLAHIAEARGRGIEVSASWLQLAAQLAHIKSQLLLPARQRARAQAQTSEAQLRARLARLEAVRRAAKSLFARPRLGLNVFARGVPAQLANELPVTRTATLAELAVAAGALRHRRRRNRAHSVAVELALPLETARLWLQKALPETRAKWTSLQGLAADRCGLADDLPMQSRTASLFAASLELARHGEAELRQSAPFAPLYLRQPG